MFEVFTFNTITVGQANNEFLGFVYGHIPYIPLKQQNEYTVHVSISYYFLRQYVLSSKNSLNCFTTFGSSVCQGNLSWVHTLWHCNLTATWPTLCHCWGVSNLMLITAYYSCLTWRSLEPCTTSLDPQARPSTYWGLNWDPFNSQCNHLSHWAISPSF